MTSIIMKKRSKSFHFNSRNKAVEDIESQVNEYQIILPKKMDDVLTLTNNNILTTNFAEFDTKRKLLHSDVLLPNPDLLINKSEASVTKKWKLGMKMDFIKDLRQKLNSPEEQPTTEQYFIKIQTDEIVCSALILSSVGSSIILHQLAYPGLNSQLNIDRDLQISATLIIITILNIIYSKPS